MKNEFIWGAATSAHQIEGGNDQSDWWEWELQGAIDGGVRSGAATDHLNRWREDLGLAAKLGLSGYRFSVEWARIEPSEGVWDEAALAWYLALIKECERLGLKPMLTLHHFSLPAWLARKGGFSWEGSVAFFGRFVAKVVEALGARVPQWCTFNEPMVLSIGSYLGKFMPPGIYAPKLASQCSRNLLRAHVMAYDLIHREIRCRREGPWKDQPLEVGIAQNLIEMKPDRKWHLLEVLLARVVSRFYNRSWLDAVTGKKPRFGIPGLVPEPALVPEALGRSTADFIGVNYYTKAYLRWRPRDASEESSQDLPIGFAFGRHTDPVSDMGWAVHPEGLRWALQMAGTYGLPLYVTENGIADAQDQLRPEYLRSHLGVIAESLDQGLDIRGYFHWSLLDNFEWIKGFKPRFGLYRVDYGTFERTPTASAELLRKIIDLHRSGRPRSVHLTKT